MDFIGIGPGELVIVFLVALLILGPDKLVDVARTLGRLSSKVSRAGREFSRTIQRETDLAKEVKEVKEAGRELAKTVRQETEGISKEFKSLKNAGHEFTREVQQEADNLSKEVKEAGRELTSSVKEATNLSVETEKGNPPEKQPEPTPPKPAENATGGQPE